MLALAQIQVPIRRPRPSLIWCAAGRNSVPYVPKLPLRMLIQVRLGDQQVRERFLTEWWPVVEDEARRYAARGGEQQELTAEGALALWEAVQAYDPQRHGSTPERYIQNHIHRRVRRTYRSAMGYDRPQLVPLEAMTPAGAADPGLIGAERRFDLDRALATLPEPEQEHLRQFVGLVAGGAGPDEAARALSVRHGGSFAAWKKRLERSRRKLKIALD